MQGGFKARPGGVAFARALEHAHLRVAPHGIKLAPRRRMRGDLRTQLLLRVSRTGIRAVSN